MCNLCDFFFLLEGDLSAAGIGIHDAPHENKRGVQRVVDFGRGSTIDAVESITGGEIIAGVCINARSGCFVGKMFLSGFGVVRRLVDDNGTCYFEIINRFVGRILNSLYI